MKGEFYKMDYEAWDEGTDALSLELEAAYLRLCHQLYRRKAAIPSAPATLARIWRCHPNKARKLLGDLIAAGKVDEKDGHLTNTRVTRELDDRETMRRQKADAGKTGGTRAQDNRRNALENNGEQQAHASPSAKQNQAEREVEREVEVEKKDTSEPKGSSGSRTRKKLKGTLCPKTFAPSESHYAKAEELGRGRDFANAICRRMIHWSHENANRDVATKADWSLALHGFIDREHDRLPPPSPGGGQIHQFPRRNPKDEPNDLLDALKNGGQHVSPRSDQFQGFDGPVIEHQGDGGSDWDVLRPSGGGAGRLQTEVHRRIASPERR